MTSECANALCWVERERGKESYGVRGRDWGRERVGKERDYERERHGEERGFSECSITSRRRGRGRSGVSEGGRDGTEEAIKLGEKGKIKDGQ